MTDLHDAAAEGFGRDAHTYEQGRPGFPPQVLDWLRGSLTLGAGSTVAELGAGTGKFTRLMMETGAHVIAVEPVAAMLAKLSAGLPEVTAVRATAQALPFADASVGAVVCAQSFHWFATRAALAEIRRVLVPGGMLGLIWNVRDRSVAWVDALSQLIDRHEGDAPRYDRGEWRGVFPAPGFAPFDVRSVAHAHCGSAEQVLIQRTASISFIAALPEARRRSVLDEVRDFICATPELADRAEICMPYVTTMYSCRVEPD